ncbi:hypothetical protein D6D04_08442 [Aureobasidium pullulans]|nr:hypothetical protein D6D04_08442 [Aureobasidium pullulans]
MARYLRSDGCMLLKQTTQLLKDIAKVRIFTSANVVCNGLSRILGMIRVVALVYNEVLSTAKWHIIHIFSSLIHYHLFKSSHPHSINRNYSSNMVQFTTLLTAALAGVSFAAPLESRASSSVDNANNVVCGALLSPLTQVFDYQSGNVGGNVEDVLAAANNILSEAKLPKDVESILSSVTGGIVGSVTNGVSNILYGLSTAAENVDPECRTNAAYCTNELGAARAACASNQKAQAQDGCLQAKYTCARNGLLTSDQVNKMAPCCSQYTGSAAAGGSS